MTTASRVPATMMLISLSLKLGAGGIRDQFPVDAAHPDPGDRPLKGDIRNLQGGRGADHGQDVRIVFLIHGQDRGDHLGFEKIVLRETGAATAGR